MAYIDQKRKYNEKYNRENYEQIPIRVPKGTKEAIQKAAANVGKSLNAYIVGAIKKEMESSP